MALKPLAQRSFLTFLSQFALKVIVKYQYRAPEDPKIKSNHVDVKDFRRLNKVVLREGATNAASNRALRANYDMKLQPKYTARSGAVANSMPNAEQAFGRANRPQTPVNGIIHNVYGEQESIQLQERYNLWKQ